MTIVKYAKILERARTNKKSVEKNKKLGVTPRWSYYFAKVIVSPKKDVTRNPNMSTTKGNAAKPSGDSFNKVKIYKADYIDAAKRLIKYVDKNKKLPNYITWKGKKIRVRDYAYNFSKIVVYYADHKAYPNYNTIDTSVWKKTTTTTTKTTTTTSTGSTTRYVSSPHWTNQGSGYLGQVNGSNCGPHSLRQCFKKFGWDISEYTLASVAGTVIGSGTDHEGLNTAIAWVAKKKGVKLEVQWKNFSDFGSTTAERMKNIGKLFSQKNVAVFFHIWYSGGGDYVDEPAYGHYEALDRINTSTSYCRALNSLGSYDGEGYYGHLQDRKFSVQAAYISGISQKSVCIITKK